MDDNKCLKCGRPGVIVEAAPDGKTRVKKCLQCGFQQVEDVQGRKLLTEVPQQLNAKRLLVEG